MENYIYFTLNSECFLIKGALRGALYDLKSGNVFSVDETSVRILECLNSGDNLSLILRDIGGINEEKVINYLNTLENQGLGNWGNVSRKKEIPLPPNLDKVLKYVLHLELTTGCNLRCLHCYNESEESKLCNDNEVPLDGWRKVITEAYQIGCRKIQFIGGEPFLKRKLLYDLILLAHSMGYVSIEVSTNATLITKKDLTFLKTYDVNLALSFYSYRNQVHDLITTRKESWGKTLTVIRMALKMAVPIRVSVIKMKHNETDVIKTIKFLKSLGVKNAKINNVEPVGRGCSNEIVTADMLCQQIIAKPFFPKTNFDIFWRNTTGHNCFSEQICVGADGNIYPCLAERKISYGNIKSISLANILSSKRAIKFRSLSKDNINVCRDCEYRYCCFDCRVRAKDFLDNDFYPKPWWCLYEPHKGKWADKEIYLKGGDKNGREQRKRIGVYAGNK